MRLNKKPGIYVLIIKSPEKLYKYVGQSINISSRVYVHKNCLKKNKHCNKYLQNVFNKHCKSIKDLEVKFINYEKDYLNIMEQTWINIIQTEDCVCLNNKPGKAQRGYTLSEEHKANISNSLKESDKAQASVKNMLKIRMENYKGKTEAQLKISREAVKSMNTPEANAKSLTSRLKSKKFKQARIKVGKMNIGNQYALGKTKGTNNGNADLTIYVFQHKKTKEIFVETRSDLILRIKEEKNKSTIRLANLISGKEKSAYGYKLLSCPLPK